MSYFSGQVRILTDIDVSTIARLRAELAKSAFDWDYWDKLKPNKFGVFDGSVKHIVLKYPIDLTNHKVSATFPKWNDWKELIQPLIDRACDTFQYERGGVARVMLAKLLPYSVIPLHVDASPSAELPHKIHIPLQTKNEVVMNFAEGDYHLSVGYAYEVNNRIQHGVSNPTDSERIHLIFDYFEN
tara:strand:+ start:645 stop:1199 length:555 start_codon:yes stop_codon:yes gene_type:complete